MQALLLDDWLLILGGPEGLPHWDALGFIGNCKQSGSVRQHCGSSKPYGFPLGIHCPHYQEATVNVLGVPSVETTGLVGECSRVLIGNRKIAHAKNATDQLYRGNHG